MRQRLILKARPGINGQVLTQNPVVLRVDRRLEVREIEGAGAGKGDRAQRLARAVDDLDLAVTDRASVIGMRDDAAELQNMFAVPVNDCGRPRLQPLKARRLATLLVEIAS